MPTSKMKLSLWKLVAISPFTFFIFCAITSSQTMLAKADPANLTGNSRFDDQNPAWSPDGSKIVFTTKRGGNNDLGIWMMSSDGSNPAVLTDEDGDDVNMPGGSWCPANDRICFSSDRVQNDEIWTVKSDGSDPQRVTNDPAPDWEPTWSPDGQWIVFQSRRGGNWDIYKVRQDGTDLTRLTTDPADDWEPNWSPKGDRIVFQSKRAGNWDIWTMNPNGSNLRNITNDPAEDTDPSWSPDGMFIVYSSDRGNADESELWIIDASVESSAPERVTNNTAYDGAPSWSPDGKRIVFESDRSGNLDIWVVDLAMEPRLTRVQDFLYVLQMDNINIGAIANSEFDLVVMDYAKYGDAVSEYASNEIADIKRGAGGRQKVVLAYMSIGEAEDYRFYWDNSWRPGSPAWLGATNPDWAGNYKVRYWMSGWKSIIFGVTSGQNKSYLDRIIDQGFDGIYLDIIDAYEYWSSSEGGNERTRTQARTDMYNFLKELRDYARVTRAKANFLIFPQNGADIIYAENEVVDALGLQYLDVCDGIGQEDLWYSETTPQPQDEYEWLSEVLDVYRTNGKLVLSTDYVWNAGSPNSASNKNRFNDYYTKANTKGYIPYAANRSRDLNDIIVVSRGNGFNFDQPRSDGGGGGNAPPNGAIDTPEEDVTINAGQSVSFTGTGADPDGNLPLAFLWDFDGAANPSTLEDAGSVTFNDAGIFNATFLVTDSLGLADPTPAERTITVCDIALIAPAGALPPESLDFARGFDFQFAAQPPGVGVRARRVEISRDDLFRRGARNTAALGVSMRSSNAGVVSVKKRKLGKLIRLARAATGDAGPATLYWRAKGFNSERDALISSATLAFVLPKREIVLGDVIKGADRNGDGKADSLRFQFGAVGIWSAKIYVSTDLRFISLTSVRVNSKDLSRGEKKVVGGRLRKIIRMAEGTPDERLYWRMEGRELRTNAEILSEGPPGEFTLGD